ncbi:hypothetical protein [Arthrobacter sp. yr096]|uniref:hypothetical protein n=1 Tax=Arthrobacter sp. yr096 TaxID=1761750 RepID=UPI00115FB729|nr:hypothetical protein [Arthrobacter sp. yr096]
MPSARRDHLAPSPTTGNGCIRRLLDRLLDRRKRPVIANDAIARELAGYVLVPGHRRTSDRGQLPNIVALGDDPRQRWRLWKEQVNA